jgi:RNA polymerase sigma-70 factor (ECF subfamily)
MGVMQAYISQIAPLPGLTSGQAPDEFVFVQPQGGDWALAQKALAGDTDAQRQLFSRYASRLYRAAFAVLRNKEDAEDAVQDGLSKAYRSLHSFQGRSSFSTWLTRIVINSARMIRRKQRNPGTSLDEILETQSGSWSPAIDAKQLDPETICSAIEIIGLVNRRCEKLRPNLKRAFRLHAIDGFSARESSDALGISVSAVKSRINRARRALAQALEKPLKFERERLQRPIEQSRSVSPQ